MSKLLERFTSTDCEHFHPHSKGTNINDPDNWVKPKKRRAEWRSPKTQQSPKFYSDAGSRGRVYWIADNTVDTLPRPLRQIETIIEQSRIILDIVPCEDNGQYDCSEQTWTRATEFLTKSALWVWDIHSKVIDIPDIMPGPDNSIDLHWEYPGYELLINIPADPTGTIGYYGDDYGVMLIKGTIDPNKINLVLLQWLAEEK